MVNTAIINVIAHGQQFVNVVAPKTVADYTLRRKGSI